MWCFVAVLLCPVSYWNSSHLESAEGQFGACACLVPALVSIWDKLIHSLRWAWNLGLISTRCLTSIKLFIAQDLTLNWTSWFLKYVNESDNNGCLVHVLCNLSAYLELYPNIEPYLWPWSYFLCYFSFLKGHFQLWSLRYNWPLCLDVDVHRIRGSQDVFQWLSWTPGLLWEMFVLLYFS